MRIDTSLALALFLVPACTSRTAPADTPQGTDAPGVDAPLADVPGTDAGGVDAARTDGGAGDDVGCPATRVAPFPTGDACESETGVCLMTATTVAEQNACFAMDADPTGCVACLTAESQASCTRMGSCADEYGPLACCLDVECPTRDAACVRDATLAAGPCGTEYTFFDICFQRDLMAAECGISATLCFR